MTKHKFVVFWTFFLFTFTALSLSIAQKSLPEIVQKVSPSVVIIFNYDEERNLVSRGSGFFITATGELITNRHVIQWASSAEAKTVDGAVYSVNNVLAEDKENDLLRLSVDIPQDVRVPHLSLTPSLPKVGEQVVVIGSPLGLEQTVSDGIVSAIRQNGEVIQITAPVSPGSSGSPVVNMRGEVIGVATFQIVEGQNLNFAIPSSKALILPPNKAQTLAEWEESNVEERIAFAKSLFSSGLDFFFKDDYENAIAYFKKALTKYSQHAGAHNYLGQCFFNLKRSQEAVEEYEKATAIWPDYSDAYFNLGNAYDSLGLGSKATEAFEQAVKADPNNSYALLALGKRYVSQGMATSKRDDNFIRRGGEYKFQKAIEIFESAVTIEESKGTTEKNNDLILRAYCELITTCAVTGKKDLGKRYLFNLRLFGLENMGDNELNDRVGKLIEFFSLALGE